MRLEILLQILRDNVFLVFNVTMHVESKKCPCKSRFFNYREFQQALSEIVENIL